jgi:hypothetical protein
MKKKSKKSIKLSAKRLRKIVLEEKTKFYETLELKTSSPEDAAKKTKEVDAGDYAGTLSKALDHVRALKIKESRLKNNLQNTISEKKRFVNAILKSLK